MLSLFSMFIVELVSFRWGTAKLSALGALSSTETIVLEGSPKEVSQFTKPDPESAIETRDMDCNAFAQIVGVFILEFGVLLHR